MSFSIRAVCTVILTLCQLTLSWLPTHCLSPNPQQGETRQATTEGAISLSKMTLLLPTEVGSKTKCQQKQRQVHYQSPAPLISVAARESVVSVGIVFTPESEPKAGLFCSSCHGNSCRKQKQKPLET